MKKQLTLSALFALSTLAFSQDFQSEFAQAFQEGDSTEQSEILAEWEIADPENPELFTSYFNYYFQQSRQEMLTVTTDQLDGESLALEDSTGQTAGFIGSQFFYDTDILQKGLDKIDEGIEIYPNRLDMRFGKTYVLGEVKNWQSFTYEIVRTIQYSSKNNNEWTWTNNEKRENDEEFFLSSLQDYQVQLYNTNNDDLLVNMRTIAEEVLKFYPDHIESLSNISVTYLISEEYDKALEALQKAKKLNPKDAIVLGNIAQAYKLKGDNKKAIQYYEKVIEFGDSYSKPYAEEQIEELKKK